MYFNYVNIGFLHIIVKYIENATFWYLFHLRNVKIKQVITNLVKNCISGKIRYVAMETGSWSP